jgi:hypothetical protein
VILYLLEERKANRLGYRSRIIAHAPCKGWRIIKKWWEPVREEGLCY